MTKIVYVPLDDRPCNLKLPQKLAAIAGAELLVPPKEFLGHFNCAGDCEKVIEWLKEVVPRASLAVISVEMIAFGGLVASRRSEETTENTRRRLQSLAALKEKNPDLQLALFTLIMKSSSMAPPDMDENDWKKIFKYSQLLDKVETFDLLDDRVDLGRLEKSLPQEQLKCYMAIRKRNHEVNLMALKLLSDGTAQYLVIGEDDAVRHGLHKKEKRLLESIIDEKKLADRVKLICGADELGMMLVGRALIGDYCPKVKIIASNDEWLGEVSTYEDVPLEDSIDGHIDAIEATRVNADDEADLLLFINCPVGKQHDLFLEGAVAKTRDYSGFVEAIRKASDAGKQVSVVDLNYVNGFDPLFMEALLSGADIHKISAVSAWNTSSNSIGAALAHSFLNLFLRNSEADGWKVKSRLYFLERIIDDYLYQGLLRGRISEDLYKRDVSASDLRDKLHAVEWVVKKELDQMAGSFIDKHFRDLRQKRPRVDISLPWPRIFEVDVNVSC